MGEEVLMARAVQGEEEVIKNPYTKKTPNLSSICVLMHTFTLRNKHIRKIKIVLCLFYAQNFITL